MSALPNLAPVFTSTSSDLISPDCRGLNFWKIDRALRDLLMLHLDETALQHFTPHFERLGELAGGRLDELALQADKHPPLLHHRDRFGKPGTLRLRILIFRLMPVFWRTRNEFVKAGKHTQQS